MADTTLKGRSACMKQIPPRKGQEKSGLFKKPPFTSYISNSRKKKGETKLGV
jgi:hypothetical protein